MCDALRRKSSGANLTECYNQDHWLALLLTDPLTVEALDRSSTSTAFLIRPRWPYDKVLISSKALHGLVAAQDMLSAHNLTLVLTRGYESRGKIIRIAHRLARIIGTALFCLAYPHRFRESSSIFSPNGHDRSGDCIDVGIVHNGDALKLLPFGVFTPLWLIRKTKRTYHRELTLAWSALEKAAFTIHGNATEAMQIHCEAQG